eukprot:6541604-Alexandrium_andersonii.AAC.1
MPHGKTSIVGKIQVETGQGVPAISQGHVVRIRGGQCEGDWIHWSEPGKYNAANIRNRKQAALTNHSNLPCET